jgi:hypothetical protein
MGIPAEPPLVMPVLGVLAAARPLLAEAREAGCELLGPIDLESEPGRWTASDYYGPEMGDEIWRQFFSFAEPCRAGRLAELKLATNRLEDRWRTERGRRVNLDPGYVDRHRLVLASTKDAAHRIYLARGIWAEVTLRYERGAFQSWAYTYPDYGEEGARAFFTRVRARLLARRRTAARADRFAR